MTEDAGTEPIEQRRKRLHFRAWHRGTREMDMLLGRFADAYIKTCGPEMLDRLERLMEEEDTDLQKWLLGQEEPPAKSDRDLIRQLTEFQIRFTAKP